MSSIILETDRAVVRKLVSSDAQSLAELMKCPLKEASTYINEWSKHDEEHGFTIYGVILKKKMALFGYCGCREIILHDRPEYELVWCIQREYPNDPNDDLDIETAFYIRNFLIKKFNIKSLFAFVSDKNARDQNVAEEIDMVTDESYQQNGEKWLVYYVNKDSPKLLGSLGSDDVEPVRTSIRNRRDVMNPAARGRKPRLMPG
ncbi:MAG: GNAT family N-acetyltransferase [Candidatus Babeliales bacterium]|uniref:GNAT family N-acetyltransferase n=1 Tax=Candidatus Berkiella aquae TaxID=295108 RepID=A0A0Q9YK56_9GAMM|nr:GNAT family N-acetyltransferase [Candidatus Berkiella aquae]MCS5712924.1 GNAT family N-acetyltransferase [Candidatus Berkiella aquae]